MDVSDIAIILPVGRTSQAAGRRTRVVGLKPPAAAAASRESPAGFHLDASLTRWPSSGSTSLVIARRTAFSEPGSEMITFFWASPAQARLSIAADPISWKLSIRNSSPKPSSRFSSSASIASNVVSRDVMPGAAGGDDHLHFGLASWSPIADAHLVRLVAHDLAPGHLVAAGPEQVEDRAPAGVGGLGAGVADRQDVAVGHGGRLRLVLQMSHDWIIPQAEGTEARRGTPQPGVALLEARRGPRSREPSSHEP